MKVYYVSSLISKSKMDYIFANSNSKPLQSIQKYHRLMCSGLSSNQIDVCAISSIPMSRKMMKKIFWKTKEEKEDNILYKYIFFINIKVLRHISILLFGFFKLIRNLIFKNKDNIVICDILNTSLTLSTLLACKIARKKCIALVTDLPRDINTNTLSSRINQLLQSRFDGYILLTKYMNSEVNKHHKPYIIIEGFSDSTIHNIKEYSNKEKVCIYAGGLYEKYGIKTLITAFEELNNGYKLHLYGDGELVEYIKNNKFTNVKYMGILKNDDMVKKEIEATLLINPRFTDNEYTKYSFPSKNIEYMSTGTPLLTTRLKGMPEEYNDYVYLFDLETTEGFKNTINNILSISGKDLIRKGKSAQKFVLEQKNNIKQCEKLCAFLQEL